MGPPSGVSRRTWKPTRNFKPKLLFDQMAAYCSNFFNNNHVQVLYYCIFVVIFISCQDCTYNL